MIQRFSDQPEKLAARWTAASQRVSDLRRQRETRRREGE